MFGHKWSDLPMISTSDESHEWKILEIYFTTDQKITVMNVLLYFLHAILCPELTKSTKNCNQLLVLTIVAKDSLLSLSIVMSPRLICGIAQTQITGIVTSHSSIVLARANWCNGDFHWWIRTVNIDFATSSIHGFACKNRNSASQEKARQFHAQIIQCEKCLEVHIILAE